MTGYELCCQQGTKGVSSQARAPATGKSAISEPISKGLLGHRPSGWSTGAFDCFVCQHCDEECELLYRHALCTC